MKRYNKLTPLGFRDYLFEESEAETEIENRLMTLFGQHGFHRVVTPTLEFLDVFTETGSTLPQERLYKLIDTHGRLLTLRPDLTVPIARMAATRLQKLTAPIRLCYTEKVYRVNTRLNGRRDEVTQSGVELLGAVGRRADLEILSMAAEALRCCGVDDFKIELGHADFFLTLAQHLGCDASAAEEIRALIESKCYAALDDAAARLENREAARILCRLPHLFGGVEVLDEAAELFGGLCAQSLSYLRGLYGDLKALGLADKVYFDLGLVHSNPYYTGLLFRGYIAGSGETVLSGGRYDNLLEQFGVRMDAVGFAVENDAMAELMLSGGQIAKHRPPEILVFGLPGYETQAILHCRKLVTFGASCENSVQETEEDALRYARKRGIARLVIVGAEIRETAVSE